MMMVMMWYAECDVTLSDKVNWIILGSNNENQICIKSGRYATIWEFVYQVSHVKNTVLQLEYHSREWTQVKANTDFCFNFDVSRQWSELKSRPTPIFFCSLIIAKLNSFNCLTLFWSFNLCAHTMHFILLNIRNSEYQLNLSRLEQ